MKELKLLFALEATTKAMVRFHEVVPPTNVLPALVPTPQKSGALGRKGFSTRTPERGCRTPASGVIAWLHCDRAHQAGPSGESDCAGSKLVLRRRTNPQVPSFQPAELAWFSSGLDSGVDRGYSSAD